MSHFFPSFKSLGSVFFFVRFDFVVIFLWDCFFFLSCPLETDCVRNKWDSIEISKRSRIKKKMKILTIILRKKKMLELGFIQSLVLCAVILTMYADLLYDFKVHRQCKPSLIIIIIIVDHGGCAFYTAIREN